MQVNQTIDNTTKNFQVTFLIQGYFLRSPRARRLTGWQPIYKAEWTRLEEARESLSKRPAKTTRYDALRIIKRIYYDGAVREEVVS